MGLKFVYTKQDGTVAIVHAVSKEDINKTIRFYDTVEESYTDFEVRKDDNGEIVYDEQGLAIKDPVQKTREVQVERPMTDDEYRSHVMSRSIPSDAINVREIDPEHIPEDRKYRDAWCDVTDSPTIDLSMVKVKDILLSNLRAVRNEKLVQSDSLVARVLEAGDDLTQLKTERQSLRDATDTLKAIAVTDNDVNNDVILQNLEAAVPTLSDPTL